MLRRGDELPTLARFRGYALHARDLDSRKAARPSSPQQAARWRAICAAHEAALDRAWGDVARVAHWYGGFHARILADHYLLGDDWHDVAAREGVSYDKTKKAAYRALLWLQAFEDAFGPL